MALEALYSLMKKQKTGNGNTTLNSNKSPVNILPKKTYPLELVTKAYFQYKPNGIAKAKASDDVLGFCSLVLSYANTAKNDLMLMRDLSSVSPSCLEPSLTPCSNKCHRSLGAKTSSISSILLHATPQTVKVR